MSTLVIRFSSMGDVVLAGAVTGALAPVVFLTLPRWAELAARLPGVVQVVRHGIDPLPAGLDRVVDLHASLRSRRVTAAIRAPVRRVRRHDLRRRSRVWAKLGAPPPRVLDRYARAAGAPPAPAPWIHVEGQPEALLLCPGAAWATKRWPADRWVAVGRAWDGPLSVLGGPEDRDLVEGIAAGIGPDCVPLWERGFDATLEALGRARVAVAGDTGLLHLCGAAGVPVVGLFGPTRSDDGFWWGAGEALEHELPCRPCSRHGSDRCPFGDHLCLEGLEPAEVLAAIHRLAP